MTAADFFNLTQQFQKPYDRLLSCTAESCGVSRIELDVLLFLQNNPGLDTAHDIVRVRGIAKSHVSKAVELLYRRGYLSAETDKADRRIVRLKLLPAATETVNAGKKAQQTFVREILRGIPEEELQTLRHVLEQINHNVQTMP